MIQLVLLDFLNDFSYKCAFALGGAGGQIVFMVTFAGTGGTTGLSLFKYWSLVHITEYFHFNTKGAFTGMIK